MLHHYTIKNNIVLFTKGPLSNWYGTYKGQENGRFKIIWDTLNECLFYKPKEYSEPVFTYDDALRRDAYLNAESLREIHCNCSEQAMMLAKAITFDDIETAEMILKEDDPFIQKSLGRKIKNYDEEKWASVRFDYVYDILKAKFEQNPDLRKFLCKDLNNYIIAEAAPWDKVWGIGLSADNPKAWDVKTWEGQNLLGKCLMKVRETLNNE